jgi:beta-galactosidase
LFWGLYNEINIPAADVKTLHETVKQIDPYRLTTQADFAQPEERHTLTDVAAWNWYYGWYYGNFGDYCPWYDKLHKDHPAIKGGLSEYGAEACISQQKENPERPDPTGRYFPEQYQSLYHERVWSEIKDRNDIWCKFIWNMFDFSWTTVTRGDKPYMNYKGLVTHDRQTKKDAFFFYKANWSEEPVLHIISRRDTIRNDSLIQVSVYTNLAEVELIVNDTPVLKKAMNSDIHKITWDNIALKKGLNQICVTGVKGDQKIMDYCEWEYR